MTARGYGLTFRRVEMPSGDYALLYYGRDGGKTIVGKELSAQEVLKLMTKIMGDYQAAVDKRIKAGKTGTAVSPGHAAVMKILQHHARS